MKTSSALRSGKGMPFSAVPAMAAFFLAMTLSILSGCDETGPSGGGTRPGEISSTLIDVSGCLDHIQSEGQALVEPLQECFEYSYDGEDVLTVKHLDFALNCCPGDITATVTIEDGLITILEAEGAGSEPCDCICLYYTEIEITGIVPGFYSIVFDDTYTGSDPALGADLHLLLQSTGCFCVERSSYPWN